MIFILHIEKQGKKEQMFIFKPNFAAEEFKEKRTDPFQEKFKI